MQLREFDITIDIILKNKIEKITIFQGETKATIFHIQITKKGVPVSLQNVEEIQVVFEDIHQNKATMICHADENNIIKCELIDEIMQLDVGKVKMAVTLHGENYRLITDYITFTIARSLDYTK